LNKVIQRQLVRWGTDFFACAGGDSKDAHEFVRCIKASLPR